MSTCPAVLGSARTSSTSTVYITVTCLDCHSTDIVKHGKSGEGKQIIPFKVELDEMQSFVENKSNQRLHSFFGVGLTYRFVVNRAFLNKNCSTVSSLVTMSACPSMPN